jgi:hypothetical protein
MIAAGYVADTREAFRSMAGRRIVPRSFRDAGPPPAK